MGVPNCELWDGEWRASPPVPLVSSRGMGEPARHLQQVGEATRAMRGVADQALEWVRVSEARVAEAETRADGLKEQYKERALLTLRKVSAEARERIAAERKARTE